MEETHLRPWDVEKDVDSQSPTAADLATLAQEAHDEDSNDEAVSEDIQINTLGVDGSVQYQLKPDNQGGKITYQLIQVANSGGAQIIPAAANLTQFVSNHENHSENSSSDHKLAYLSTLTDNQAGGQIYLMMSPPDVIGGSRNISPRVDPMNRKMEFNKNQRDEKRRALHNEVERRRRDKINKWITELAQIIPDCTQETSKHGQIHIGLRSDLVQGEGREIKLTENSKGGILQKAVEYIKSLKMKNEQLLSALDQSGQLSVGLQIYKDQIDELKRENAVLKAQLSQSGLLLSNLQQQVDD